MKTSSPQLRSHYPTHLYFLVMLLGLLQAVHLRAANLLLDFGPTTVTNASPGFDATIAPGYSLTNQAVWNKVHLADIATGLVNGDGSAATGVMIDLGQESAAGSGIINFATQPTGATLTGTSGGSGIYSGTRLPRDGTFGSPGCAIGLRVGGLPGGTYKVYFTARNTNSGSTDRSMRVYAMAAASAGTFDFTAHPYKDQSNSTPITATSFVEGANYNVIDITLVAGNSLFLAVEGTNPVEPRGFLNSLEIVPNLETIGGGTIATAAVGPAPSYGIGGPGFTLVKNWNFGANGTIKNYADMNANFNYHTQNGVLELGYGAKMVAPNTSTALYGQPIENVHTPGPVREFFPDSLKTYLVPLGGATNVKPSRHDAGSGSFVAKWSLPGGAGALLGQDLVWETRVRYVPPKQFWFSIWNAGRQWSGDGGPEVDLIESFGYTQENGQWANLIGEAWHSETNGGVIEYGSWVAGMSSVGINFNNYDAGQYHTWTWLYTADNVSRIFVDGIEVQRGGMPWRFAGVQTGYPVDMHFLFDATWGHEDIAKTNHEMPATEFVGKYFEWDYSRVYLRGTPALPPVENVTATQIPAGSWGVSTNGEGKFFGANFLNDGNTGKGSKSVRYTPTIPVTGEYQVYTSWAAGGHATNVPYTITHANGVANVTKNQNVGSNWAQWHLLGTYTFNAGTSGHVLVSNTGTNNWVVADDVYFISLPPTEIIVDGGSRTGSWSEVKTEVGVPMNITPGQYQGTGYFHDGNSGKGPNEYTTSNVTLPAAGTYKVYAKWNNSTTHPRATNVPYTITHANGTSNVIADQSVNGGQWNLLGAYDFGTTGKVVTGTTGTNGYVVLDAIKWVKQ